MERRVDKDKVEWKEDLMILMRAAIGQHCRPIIICDMQTTVGG